MLLLTAYTIYGVKTKFDDEFVERYYSLEQSIVNGILDAVVDFQYGEYMFIGKILGKLDALNNGHRVVNTENLPDIETNCRKVFAEHLVGLDTLIVDPFKLMFFQHFS